MRKEKNILIRHAYPRSISLICPPQSNNLMKKREIKTVSEINYEHEHVVGLKVSVYVSKRMN